MTNQAARLYEIICREFGNNNETSFCANVILTNHKAPVKKLRGMLRLLRNGNTVRCSHFDLDQLLIDGEPRSWNTLHDKNVAWNVSLYFGGAQ